MVGAKTLVSAIGPSYGTNQNRRFKHSGSILGFTRPRCVSRIVTLPVRKCSAYLLPAEASLFLVVHLSWPVRINKEAIYRPLLIACSIIDNQRLQGRCAYQTSKHLINLANRPTVNQSNRNRSIRLRPDVHQIPISWVEWLKWISGMDAAEIGPIEIRVKFVNGHVWVGEGSWKGDGGLLGSTD